MKPQRPENVGSIYFFWCVFREEEEGKEKWGRSSTTKHCRLVRCCRNCRRSGNDFQSIFWKVVVGFSNREQKWKVINKKEKKKESRGCGVRVCPAWRITAESRAAACGVYRNTKDDRRSCLVCGYPTENRNGEKVHPRIRVFIIISSCTTCTTRALLTRHFKSIAVKMLFLCSKSHWIVHQNVQRES